MYSRAGIFIQSDWWNLSMMRGLCVRSKKNTVIAPRATELESDESVE